ncbi:MAG: AAC(3) family N-acetyltransferase [Clostridia bacterium]|nr:AAC(3) family N-acetyltransferase [Clostridia bacterium]
MYTKQDLILQLQQMGLKPRDAVMMHSSMKAIGPVEGGADTVLDALTEYFAPGLFMTPTHTWRQMGPEHPVFDPAAEPSCVGLLTNLFMRRPGVVRSLHPTHSIAAFGPGAAEYIRGEENVTTPCAPEGVWGRLLKIRAKVLLVGVTHARNTYIHAVEEMLDVPERLTDKPVDFTIVTPDGGHKPVKMHRHFNPVEAHISERFVKLTDCYFETGAAVRGRLGDAECILCDCEKLYEVTKKVLSHHINTFIDVDPVPPEWWRE